MSDNPACEICGEPAEYTCSMCGRRVCAKHFSLTRRICHVCEDALCEICGKRLSVGYCKICGRLGCEDCLIQVNPVEYVCRECLYKTGRNGGRIEDW